MGLPVVEYANTFSGITCCECGVVFYVPEYFQIKRVQDKRNFWCPNGHSQSYQGETAQQKLKKVQEQLAWEQKKSESLTIKINEAWQAEQEAKRKARELKKRYIAGVCPCCNRTFIELQKHMKTKHPDFTPEDEATPTKRRGRPKKEKEE